jgi:signal transduction histidine kinase
MERSGVPDVEGWLLAHPEEVASLARAVRVLDVNAAGLALTGATSKAEAVASLDQYFTPESLPAFARALLRLVQGSPLVDCELAFRDRLGRIITVIAYAAPLPGSEETLDHVLVSFFDVTARKEAERQLRESVEAQLALAEQLRHAAKMESLGRLAGGVAHDFNNMLAVILGHVDLALKRPDLASGLREDLHAVRDAAARSAELTRQLLGFARQQPIRPRPIDLGQAISGMGRMLEKLAGERIALELDLAPDLWPTLVDPSQVDQVVTNLVANARDAIAGRGTIRIATGNAVVTEPHAERTWQVAPGEYATLTVADTGAGMDPLTVRHLFEPFFTTKPVGRGTGLGLATVYGIVRQNRGGVEVRTAPGGGSLFCILFPRHRGPAVEAPALTPSREVAPRGAETILVVEDEPTVLNVIRRSLETCGYRVLAFEAPAKALALLQSSAPPIDLLVTDMMMPGMTGRELVEAAILKYPGLRVLLLSGHAADVVSGVELAEEGFEFLQKPFPPSELALRVRELLDR